MLEKSKAESIGKPKQSHIKKIILFVIKLLVTTFCIFHIFKAFGHEINLIKSTLNFYYLVSGVVLFVVSQLIAIWRWKTCCKKLGILEDSKGFCKVTYFELAKHYFIGLFCNNFLPGSVGGDFVRAYLLKKNIDNSQWTLCIGSVFVDRAFGLLAMCWIGLIASLIIKTQTGLPLSNVIVYGLLSMCAASLVGVFVVIMFSKFLPAIKNQSPEEEEQMNLWDKVLFKLSEFAEALRRIKRDKQALSLIVVSSFVIQLLVGLCLISLANGLGLDIQSLYLWIINPLATLGAIIAPSINGLGVRENIYAYFFKAIGETGGDGVILSAAWLLTLLIGSLPGAIFLLKKVIGNKSGKDLLQPELVND